MFVAEEEALVSSAAINRRNDGGGEIQISEVHAQIIANKGTSLSTMDQHFIQWHIETEYGGDWGNDPADLKPSTYHNAVDGQSDNSVTPLPTENLPEDAAGSGSMQPAALAFC